MSVSTDLKLANILTGIMSHSAAYPCIWCEAPKSNMRKEAKGRTISGIKNNHEEWLENGAKLMTAKQYRNCIHIPIIGDKSLSENNTKILDVIPPPELHLLIGM